MHLRFGGARADGPPADQVADELRRDHVEEFAAGRHTRLVDAQQEVAGNAQALVDAKAVVQVGVVDEALPAHRGAWLLEIHTHDDLEIRCVALALLRQAHGVFDRGVRVMNRARPDHHQQAVRLAVQDALQFAARRGHQRLDRRALDREETDQVLRRGQRHDAADALVVGERGAIDRRVGRVQFLCVFHVHFLQVRLLLMKSAWQKKTARLLALAVSGVRYARTSPVSPPVAGKTKSTQNKNGCCSRICSRGRRFKGATVAIGTRPGQ